MFKKLQTPKWPKGAIHLITAILLKEMTYSSGSEKNPVCPFILFLCEAPRSTGFDTNKRYYYCHYYKSKTDRKRTRTLFVLAKYGPILTVPANNELSAQIRRYTEKLI